MIVEFTLGTVATLAMIISYTRSRVWILARPCGETQATGICAFGTQTSLSKGHFDVRISNHWTLGRSTDLRSLTRRLIAEHVPTCL